MHVSNVEARRALIPAIILALVLPAAAIAEPTDWTQWGGPRTDFRAPAEGIAWCQVIDPGAEASAGATALIDPHELDGVGVVNDLPHLKENPPA